MGYLSLMEEGIAGPVTPSSATHLAQVKMSSHQLLDLIGDLLALTTLRRGGLEIAKSAFDVREPMHEAISVTRGRVDGVALRVSEPEAPVMMVSDQRMIARLLIALLSNAYKFTSSGEVKVSVTTHNGRVVYRVVDTGIGIPESMQSKVFEEFRQVDGSTTRRLWGFGARSFVGPAVGATAGRRDLSGVRIGRGIDLSGRLADGTGIAEESPLLLSSTDS